MPLLQYNTVLFIYELYSIILYPSDKATDILSNISLHLKEFPRPKPKGTLEDKGVYLTVYPNTESISF